MDLSEVYNNPDYSDLALILQDGREVKVHKNILCTSNQWFKKACGIGSSFVEATQAVLELKHEDPDALEQVLRHIYRIPPWKLPEVKSWRHWLNVHLTADKYLEPELSVIARDEFTRMAYSQRDANEIFDIIETINDEVNHNEDFVRVAYSLRECHIEKLLENDRVCKKVDEDKTWRWEIIDTLVGQRKRSVLHSIFLCGNRISQVFVPGRRMKLENCSLCHGSGDKATMKPCTVHFVE